MRSPDCYVMGLGISASCEHKNVEWSLEKQTDAYMPNPTIIGYGLS
jgi:hypothetical protein